MTRKIPDVSELIITAPTTALAGIGKLPNTESDTEMKTLSKLVLEQSWGTLLETVDWSNLAAVKIAVNSDGLMDITTITPNQWLSDGCAPLVTSSGTPSMERPQTDKF